MLIALLTGLVLGTGLILALGGGNPLAAVQSGGIPATADVATAEATLPPTAVKTGGPPTGGEQLPPQTPAPNVTMVTTTVTPTVAYSSTATLSVTAITAPSFIQVVATDTATPVSDRPEMREE